MLAAETRQMGERREVVEAKLRVPLYSTQRNNQGDFRKCSDSLPLNVTSKFAT